MLRSVILAGFAGLVCPAGMATGEAYSPPPVGQTTHYWYRDLDANTTNRVKDTIIWTGDDFALHENISYTGLGLFDRSSLLDEPFYFVEYSGFYVHFCDSELPGPDVRETVFSAWPLEEGEVIDVRFDDVDWTYTVLAPETHTLANGDVHDVIKVHSTDNASEEGYVETVSLSKQTHTYVKGEYGDWGRDWAFAVSRTDVDQNLSSIDLIKIGTCASLIVETLGNQSPD